MDDTASQRTTARSTGLRLTIGAGLHSRPALLIAFAFAVMADPVSSAVIASVPSLASARVPIAIGVLAAVAALTWFGHLGRAVFAVMTLGFVGAGLAVLVGGMGAAIPAHHAPSSAAPGHAAFIAV